MKKIILLIILAMLTIYNLVTFAVYGYDKKCAIKNKRRISEKQLILMALCFGGIGAFLGMQIFRHKTKHIKFQILIPLFMVVQIVVCIMLVIYV